MGSQASCCHECLQRKNSHLLFFHCPWKEGAHLCTGSGPAGRDAPYSTEQEIRAFLLIHVVSMGGVPDLRIEIREVRLSHHRPIYPRTREGGRGGDQGAPAEFSVCT